MPSTILTRSGTNKYIRCLCDTQLHIEKIYATKFGNESIIICKLILSCINMSVGEDVKRYCML